MVIDEKMVNPFRNQTSVNIAPGQISDSDEILQAKENGLSAQKRGVHSKSKR
jgi:hypothetical protein